MKCKDCIHYDLCVNIGFCINDKNEAERRCRHFKNKSKFIELPCYVGNVVYQLDTNKTNIYETEITRIIFDTDTVAFDERSIGKTIFLTREEAEKAVKGREKE